MSELHAKSIATIQDELADAMNLYADRMNELADAMAAGQAENLSVASAILRDMAMANSQALGDLLVTVAVLANAIGEPDLIEGDGIDVDVLR